MAVYHKATNIKVKRGDTVLHVRGIEMTVTHIFEYQHRGAGVGARAKHSTTDIVREYLCSEVGCFHSTGDAEVFNAD